MILYPAIDILGGKCVRLTRGDFKSPTVYFADPVEAARRWVEQGAAWLHVVDLDGAREGHAVNLKPIEKIMTSFNIPVQIGGGIRTQEAAEIFLTMGAGRIVLGSVILEDPDLAQILCTKFPERVALGIDAQGGKVAIHGWQQTSDKDPVALARELEPLGPGCFIVTDIARDGTLQGPNFESLRTLTKAVNVPVTASGGISSLDDLKKLKEIGCEGAILGRSLYEGKIDLKKAIGEC